MREKQIEEIARLLCGMSSACNKCVLAKARCYEYKDAEKIYNAGYRKQSEGEWVHTDMAQHWFGKDECNQCHYHDCKRIDLTHLKFCPNCGAHMLGGTE